MPYEPDLESAAQDEIDVTAFMFDYERYRQLARNPNLSPQQKIGFPDSYRDGFDAAILADIAGKLGGLDTAGTTLADIGSGCGSLANALACHCETHGVSLVLVDSPEMLERGPDAQGIVKVAGRFPANAAEVLNAAPGGYDHVLSYSVLHCIFVDRERFEFLDSIINLLKPGGLALIGDIPNVSKRQRFFSSAEGIAFHKRFMNTSEPPSADLWKMEHGKLDDGVLASLVQRAQNRGCDAYVLPQGKNLPMANRRDDLLIRKY